MSQDDDHRSPTTTIDGQRGWPAPASAAAPDRPATDGGSPTPGAAEEERLEALIARLGELEGGLREELAVQVERAEEAERALAATEARAVRAEVAARATAPPAVPASPVPEPAPPAPATSDADREALATALREVRAYLERRREVEGEIVTIARDALSALRGGSPGR